jgi:two-component system response regulator DctR
VKMFKTLLIEDDPMVQEVNREFIEKVEGFKVLDVASDGTEGIQKTKEVRPDLVILDIYMPGRDGLDVLHQIRKENHPVDVIAVTAANDMETIRNVLQLGAIDYIVKPFKFKRIKQSLESYRTFRNQLENQHSISQEKLDRILYPKQQKHQQELPKGLNAVTLKQIMLFLMKEPYLVSAEEVAEGIGTARVTARRYLDYLEKKGELKIDIEYGGVGRPVNRYVWVGHDQKD